MRHFSLTLTLTAALASGVAQADPLAHIEWPQADDTVHCLAIGCAETEEWQIPEFAPPPFVPEPAYHWPMERGEADIPNIHLEPIALLQMEDEVRADYHRALRDHADGKGTIEHVEEAYQRLLPYR